MVLSTLWRAVAAGGVLAIVGMGAPAARAFDILWLTAGTGDWNTPANWTGGNVPSAFFEEVGVINNGGTATLSATIANSVGGVVLGQAAADTGTLSIGAGGAFLSETSASTNGVVAVGALGRGTLNVTGNGTLTAAGVTVGGVAASQANFSGTATVLINGATTISRNLRITGPTVNFNTTGAVTLQGTSALTAEITSLAGHSPVKSPTSVALGGTLNVQFNGVTPAIGNSWDIVDATAISGNFANAAIGGNVTVTGAPAPAVGSAYRLRQVAGGTHGQRLQVALENMLVLRVNRDTGEMTIRNPLGAPVTQFDGYTITSPVGSLLSTYKGISGAPAGNAGWEKAPANSTLGLAEFKPTGVFDVSSAATNVTLGTGFSRTAVASQPLGTSGEDLTFRYHAKGGAAITGQVEYIGTPYLNNISLIVNTTNGQATLKNDTLISRSIDGYSILSATGALNGATWNSLADRPGSFPDWLESPATVNALSETNPVAPLTLTAGQSISLGSIGNFSTQAARDGLSMKFIFGNENTFRLATISFTTTTGQPGDFDGNGRVDGHDFLRWQRGSSPNPLSSGDLAIWRANFGAGAAGAATAAVPEPAAAGMAGFAAMGLFASRNRFASRRPKSPNRKMGGRKTMIRTLGLLVAALASTGLARPALGVVTLTFDANQPTLGTYDQSQLLDDATIPGGTTPGGGTYNSQAYTDNAGPLGQTFSTPATKHIYALTGVSVKGVGDTGDVIGSATTTWAIRISEVSGTNLIPLKTHTGIPTVTGAVGNEWFTISMTGTDAVTLSPSKEYAFEIYTTGGYWGVDATQGDAYVGGQAFNSAGIARTFANNTLGNLANHGYDRTFATALAAPPGGPGDVNNDTFANIADYHIIRGNLEKSVPIFTDGDLTGDSYVDLNDFRQWTIAAPPEVVASIGVPEPSSMALCAAALALPAVRRRLRRISREYMRRPAVARTCALTAMVVALTCLAPQADAAVTMSRTTTAPTPGTYDQANLLDDQTIPGGTTPGGGTYNSQAFSDNNGPPGQTFTTPGPASGTLPVFALNSVWLKGANTGGGNSGGGVFTTATWGVRISSLSDQNLIPIKTITLIPTVTGGLGNEWYAWTFSGDSIAVLQPNTQYAFDVFSSGGYLGFDAALDASYAGGTAFNSLGPARTFTDTTLGNLANHGYDRTFLVALTPSAINIGPGDVDLDGDTDLVDYNFIKNNFFLASGATRAQGDLSGDGRVDIDDYGLWKNNAPAAVLAGLGVPEPAGLALAAFGAAAMAARRRLRRRPR
jgi:hypothetical protein